MWKEILLETQLEIHSWKKTTHTVEGTTLRGCSPQRFHAGAAVPGSPEESSLRSKDQRIKTFTNTTPESHATVTSLNRLGGTEGNLQRKQGEFSLGRYLLEDEPVKGARKELM